MNKFITVEKKEDNFEQLDIAFNALSILFDEQIKKDISKAEMILEILKLIVKKEKEMLNNEIKKFMEVL